MSVAFEYKGKLIKTFVWLVSTGNNADTLETIKIKRIENRIVFFIVVASHTSQYPSI